MERFDALSLTRGEIEFFAGRELLPFEDPEGQRLYLVNDQEAAFEGEIWPHPEIPAGFALRGFFSAVLSVPERSMLDTIFTQILNFSKVKEEFWIDKTSTGTVYTTSEAGGPGTEIWLLEQRDLAPARLGAGGVHHVAFRVEDSQQQAQWLKYLREAGLSVSQQIDRFWFESIYFRVSPGILFEIATDGPGFTIDEDPAALGEKLVLPPFLEDRRVEIEKGLVPI
jgi:glyoxalase family protein